MNPSVLPPSMPIPPNVIPKSAAAQLNPTPPNPSEPQSIPRYFRTPVSWSPPQPPLHPPPPGLTKWAAQNGIDVGAPPPGVPGTTSPSIPTMAQGRNLPLFSSSGVGQNPRRVQIVTDGDETDSASVLLLPSLPVDLVMTKLTITTLFSSCGSNTQLSMGYGSNVCDEDKKSELRWQVSDRRGGCIFASMCHCWRWKQLQLLALVWRKFSSINRLPYSSSKVIQTDRGKEY